MQRFPILALVILLLAPLPAYALPIRRSPTSS